MARGGPQAAAAHPQAPASGGLNLSGGSPAGRAPQPRLALDFQFDQTSDGRILRLLNTVDEHSREELDGLVERRIDADHTVAALDDIVTKRGGAPEFIRCDNRPELTANALRDWCRFSGTGTSYIEPGSPWENPFVESFGSRLRGELLSVEQFDTLLEAQVMIGDWKHEYNNYRPATSRKPEKLPVGRQFPILAASSSTELRSGKALGRSRSSSVM